MNLNEIRTLSSSEGETIYNLEDLSKYFDESTEFLRRIIPEELCYRTLPQGKYPSIPYGKIYITQNGLDILHEESKSFDGIVYGDQRRVLNKMLKEQEVIKLKNEEAMPTKKEKETHVVKGEVKIFSNPAFGEIRTTGTSEQPLFCLADVCKALDLSSTEVNRRLEKGVVSKHPLPTKGGTQQALFVNEDGLYDVILDSRKPEAKQFRKWVTSEVLPSIRKTGGYIAMTPTDTEEELMARALIVAQSTLERYRKEKERLAEMVLEQEELLEVKTAKIEKRDAKIEKDAPKVEYHDAVLLSENTYTITQIAKECGISSGKRLNEILKEKKIQYFESGQWLLFAKYAALGYTKTRTFVRNDEDGKPQTFINTVWTEKGRHFIHSLLK